VYSKYVILEFSVDDLDSTEMFFYRKYFQRLHATKKSSHTSTSLAPKPCTTTWPVSSTVTHNTAESDSSVNDQGNHRQDPCSFLSNQDSNFSNFPPANMDRENQSDSSTYPGYSGVISKGTGAYSTVVARNVKPYMKKYRPENSASDSLEKVDLYSLRSDYDVFQHQSQSGEDFSILDYSSVSRNVKPYVRKRCPEETGSSRSDFSPVIPTAILNTQTYSSTPKLKKVV
jgi:hypothetical protein